MATAAAFLALAIEAEWRKHAAGVVPAQPKARPEGQRPYRNATRSRPNFSPPSLKLKERIACAFRTILRQERHQAERKKRASADRSHEAAGVAELANRISAETPTSAPPTKQNICCQIAEGIASWVTPWTSA